MCFLWCLYEIFLDKVLVSSDEPILEKKVHDVRLHNPDSSNFCSDAENFYNVWDVAASSWVGTSISNISYFLLYFSGFFPMIFFLMKTTNIRIGNLRISTNTTIIIVFIKYLFLQPINLSYIREGVFIRYVTCFSHWLNIRWLINHFFLFYIVASASKGLIVTYHKMKTMY